MRALATDWLRWILFLPLIGAALNVSFGKRLSRQASGIVASAAVAGSFALSLALLTLVTDLSAGSFLRDSLWSWISSGAFRADFSLMADPLVEVMILVVTGVGLLIHVYSIGYMAGDESVARYFAYLNLFVFFMLLLVMADNLVLMFVGWEGVGLSSYLLIGFWFEKKENAEAGKKAFVVNRIGDFGFVLGLFLLAWSLTDLGGGSLDFSAISQTAPRLNSDLATAITLLLFVGAIGKSAQIPLYVWLPDAMAGPTPVSALIHAATMVTAGVYMIARLDSLYLLSPTALHVVAVVGSVTSIFAATIALVQNDIKKVLAYSTVSQLGIMFLGLGVGAFSQSVFHLVTHAFFKALLFLGAGSVIHALGGEQNIQKMGGLGKKLPITMWTFLAASLALSGIWPFSGYYSKDAILWMSYGSPLGSPPLWALGVLGAGLTAFYIFRVFFLTFLGESRMDIPTWMHAHESPPVMTLPLIVLAVLSLMGGWWADGLGTFLSPVLRSSGVIAGAEEMEKTLAVVPLISGAAGVILAAVFYLLVPSVPAKGAVLAGPLYRLLLRKYYVDEIYDAIIVRPLQGLSLWFWRALDVRVIDGFVNRLGDAVLLTSSSWRRIQTGNVQHYALGFLLGALLILAVMLGRA